MAVPADRRRTDPRRTYPVHDDWATRPVSRRAVLAAGATALGVALAGCAGGARGPVPDPVAIDAAAPIEPPESEPTQMQRTRSDSTEYVGAAPEHHDTIQAAVDAASPGGTVHVTPRYDSSLERWPVVAETAITVEAAGLRPEIEVADGRDGLVFDVDNKRPPGPVLRNLRLTGGARGFVFRGTKFPKLYDCHVADCSGVAYAFEDTRERDGRTYRNGTNSAELHGCTSLRAGEAGLRTGYLTHAILLDACRMLHSGGFGVYFDGPSNCVVRGGQYENNADAGIFARVAESVTVRDAYVEENGQGTGHFSANLVAKQCEEVLVEGCYFNGLGTPYGVVFRGDAASAPTVRDCRFKSHARANVLTDVADTDVDRAAANVDPRSGATRVRDGRTIVGPTGEGVNLRRTAGRDPGDRALSRGTPGVPDGALAVWLDEGRWRLADGDHVGPDT